MSAPTTLLDLAQELWLGWLLLPRKKMPTQAEAQKALRPILSDRLTDEDWKKVVGGAIANGLAVAERAKGARSDRFALTDSGRREMIRSWSAHPLPSRLQWKTFVRRFVTPRLLGLPKESCVNSEQLMCGLVRREFGIDPKARTATQVLVALAGKRLHSFPSIAAPNADVVLLATLQQYVDQANGMSDPGASAVSQKPEDDHFVPDVAFAEFVRSAAENVPRDSGGWFGDRKVFIARVYDQLHQRSEFANLDLDDFKRRLIAAHRGRLLELGRADLVGVMNSQDVAASEVRDLNSEFHFICIR